MDVRNILVSLDPLVDPASLLGRAATAAEALGAKVSVSAAAQPWMEAIGAEIGPAALALYEEQRAQIEVALNNLETSFMTTIPSSLRGSFRSLIDEPTQNLIESAVTADLIMVGARSVGTTNPQIHVNAGKVVLSAGRPVMLVAEGVDLGFEAIVVAWKDTREARRALSDALPMLKLAKQVLVASVDEDDYAAERESLTSVVGWLDTHGIKARGDVLPRNGSVVETLAVAAKSTGANMIVAGGYGHTRLREWLFGGATYDMLRLLPLHRMLSN